MRARLLLVFHEDINFVDWATFSANGQVIDFKIAVTLESLLPIKAPTIALIPSTQLTITQVTIPSRRWQQVLQAVPYAVEDQLAEEIEQLHFAVKKLPSAAVSVAIINRILMDTYQAILKSVKVTHLTPDVLAIPKPTNGWGILQYQNRVLVRTDVDSGFATEMDTLVPVLQAALANGPIPEQWVIFNTTSATTGLCEILQIFDIPIVEQQHSQALLGWFTECLSQNKPFNLLQGDYQLKHPLSALWQPWRLTVWLGIGLISILLVERGIDYQKLRQQQQQLTTDIIQIYQHTFPKTRKIVDPRAQMAQQLKQLQAKQGQSPENFLVLLQQINAPFKQIAGLTIQQLDYQKGQFNIRLTAKNLRELETLKQQLNTLGFMADIQVATHRQTVVDSQLRIWRKP